MKKGLIKILKVRGNKTYRIKLAVSKFRNKKRKLSILMLNLHGFFRKPTLFLLLTILLLNLVNSLKKTSKKKFSLYDHIKMPSSRCWFDTNTANIWLSLLFLTRCSYLFMSCASIFIGLFLTQNFIENPPRRNRDIEKEDIFLISYDPKPKKMK